MNSDNNTTLDVQANDVNVTLTGTIYINSGCIINWGTGNSTMIHVGGE